MPEVIPVNVPPLWKLAVDGNDTIVWPVSQLEIVIVASQVPARRPPPRFWSWAQPITARANDKRIATQILLFIFLITSKLNFSETSLLLLMCAIIHNLRMKVVRQALKVSQNL